MLVHVQSHTVKYTAVRESVREMQKCKESKALTEQPLGDDGEVVALGTYNVRLLCCAFGQVHRTVLSPSKVTPCVLKRYRTEALKLAHKHNVTGTPVLRDISDCMIPRKSLDKA